MLNQKTTLLFSPVFVRFWVFKSLYLYRTKQKSSCMYKYSSITDFLYHRLLTKCSYWSLKRQIWLFVNNLRIYFCFILSWGKRDISQGKECVVLRKTEHTKEKVSSGNWWTFTKMLEAILRMSEIEDDDERGLATLHLPQKFCNYLNFEARKFKQCKL